MSGWTLDNPVFVNYCLCSGVLAVKLLLMVPITAHYRFTKKVFANEEDLKLMGGKAVKLNDPDVERIRRAHQNDVENIPVFWILGLLYVLTIPSQGVAKVALWSFTVARVIYTVLYVSGSPHRSLSFIAGMAANLFLGVNVIAFFVRLM